MMKVSTQGLNLVTFERLFFLEFLICKGLTFFFFVGYYLVQNDSLSIRLLAVEMTSLVCL